MNALLRKSIEYSIEELIKAAVKFDLTSLHRAAIRLKQMTLCHSPNYDHLAIAAYRLQLAATSRSAEVMHTSPPKTRRRYGWRVC